MKSRLIFTILGPLVGVLLILFFDFNTERPETTRMAAVAAWMAIWWMTEAVPLAVTALLPISLFPLLGIMNGKLVSSAYCNYIIFTY